MARRPLSPFADRCWRAGRWLYLMARRERVALNVAREGEFWVEGTARKIDRTLTSPLMRRECLAYSLDIWGLTDSPNPQSRRWGSVYSRREALPFELDDGTAAARIEADGSIELSAPNIAERAAILDLPSDIYLLVNKHKHLKVVERCLAPGEHCSVVGKVVRLDPGKDVGGYRQATVIPVIGPSLDILYLAAWHKPTLPWSKRS